MKTLEELGRILNNMYTNAPRKEQVTWIHLFSAHYADDIRAVGVKEVVEESKIRSTYKAEVNKGVNIAKYVTINNDEFLRSFLI